MFSLLLVAVVFLSYRDLKQRGFGGFGGGGGGGGPAYSTVNAVDVDDDDDEIELGSVTEQ